MNVSNRERDIEGKLLRSLVGSSSLQKYVGWLIVICIQVHAISAFHQGPERYAVLKIC